MAVIKFIRSLLEAPRVHAAVRTAVAERADADSGQLVGIDHEDGAGVVEYVLIPTSDDGYTFVRVIDDGNSLKFGSPADPDLSRRVLEAWYQHVKDLPSD